MRAMQCVSFQDKDCFHIYACQYDVQPKLQINECATSCIFQENLLDSAAILLRVPGKETVCRVLQVRGRAN